MAIREALHLRPHGPSKPWAQIVGTALAPLHLITVQCTPGMARRNGARTLAGAAALALAGARGAPGQQLTATEAAVGAATVLAHRSFWGGGVGLARRTGGQGRLAATDDGGAGGGAVGVRGCAGAQG